MSKKILVITPRYGLCNQLSSISKGIIYAFLTNRDIIFNGFQLDYRHDDNLMEFHEVINIEELQKTIYKYNLNIIVSSNKSIIGEKIDTHNEKDVSHIKDFIPYLFHENNINKEVLYIGNPISSKIPIEYMKLQNLIECEINFTLKYNLMAKNVIKSLGLKNYICIHLRLEDDAINYIKIKKGFINVDIDLINDSFSEEELQKCLSTYFAIDNIEKPLKAFSSYKLDDLIKIAEQLQISIYDENGKKRKKQDYYEKIVQKLA
jgi:hypothetical protein